MRVEPAASSGAKWDDSVVRSFGTVSDGRKQILPSQLRVIAENLFRRFACRHLVKEQRNPYPRAPNAWLSEAYLRIDADAFQ
jgi:hypothetical protein